MKINIKVTVDEEEREKSYRVGMTRAPRAYDYATTLELRAGLYGTELDSNNRDYRLVAISTTHVDQVWNEAQVMRYASGMYGFNEDITGVYVDIIALIFNRIYVIKEN